VDRHGPFAFALPLIFFASGAAGLIFELVWFYRCSLVFGSSVWAATIVLSSFMGGLACGNWLVAWYRDRLDRPLRAYAVAELVVAAAGVTLSLTLPTLTGVIARLPGTGLLVRFGTAFALLLVPSAAMGTTLPLVVAAVCRRRERFGAALGRLYGANTLGAVAGVVSAELVLINRFGVSGTAWSAGLLDAGAGAAAFLLSRREEETGAQRRPVAADGGGRVQPGAWAVLTGSFLAGGSLLALEVVWFRFLSMYVLTTTLALSLMLAVLLTAIAIGGLAASAWLARSREGVRTLPIIGAAAVCALVGSYAAFGRLTGGTQVGEWYRVLWFVLALAFPTALLSGVLFTLLGEALHRQIAADTPGARSAQAAAWLTLANTIGATCGSTAALFLLLPFLGMERALFAIAAVYGVIALITALPAVTTPPTSALRRRAGLGAAILIAVALFRFPFGSMADEYFPRAARAYTEDGSAIVATREGPSESIFLMQQTWLGQPVYSRLVTNGFSMSGTSIPAMRYMRYFVYLPMLLRKAPLRRVLVICYGVGVTAGAATDLSSVESLDVVEISRDIVAMSDLVYAGGHHPLHDPRVRVHYEDGRYFLQTTREDFDLITGEPPPPRTPGAVNIYTREYFGLIRERLSDGGIATYWLPVARPNPGTDVSTIIRAFCEVFEDCSLWNATPFDLMLVGTRNGGGPVSASDLARPWTEPRLAASLREVGFEVPEQIGATFIGDAARLRQIAGGAPPLTDDFPQRLRPDPGRPSLSDPRYGVDEQVAQLYQAVIDPGRARQAFTTSTLVRRLLPDELIRDTLPYFDEQRMINRVLWEGGKPLRVIDDLDTVLTRTGLKTLPLWILGSDAVKQRIGLATDDGSGTLEYVRGLDALAARDYLGAAREFARSERQGFPGTTVRGLMVYALCRAGQLEAASRLARGAEARDADEQHFWGWLRARFGVG
jgi:predicted membrane-bound spermidine synthase